MTKLKQILAGSVVGLALITGSAASARDRDHDGRPDHSWAERHDRDGYRDNWRYDRRADRRDHRWDRRHVVSHDVIYRNIRNHHYRYIGAPYWYGDYYIVRAYDPYGRIVYVRVDPYSGAWLSVSFRL